MINIFKNKNNLSYTQFTISLSYYNDKSFLNKQLETFSKYDKKIKIQIIDDGSQKEPIEDLLESIPKHISVFKILDDIKWNITGITEIIADDNSQIIFI